MRDMPMFTEPKAPQNTAQFFIALLTRPYHRQLKHRMAHEYIMPRNGDEQTRDLHGTIFVLRLAHMTASPPTHTQIGVGIHVVIRVTRLALAEAEIAATAETAAAKVAAGNAGAEGK